MGTRKGSLRKTNHKGRSVEGDPDRLKRKDTPGVVF